MRGCGPGDRLTTPASSRTRRCCSPAWRLIRYGSASWFTVASATDSRATMSRRVGSARAANVLDSVSVDIRSLLLTSWLKDTIERSPLVVKRAIAGALDVEPVVPSGGEKQCGEHVECGDPTRLVVWSGRGSTALT